MAMTERQIRNWEVRQLRNMYHLAKLLKLDMLVLDAIDTKLVEHNAKPERERMNNIHTVMSNSGHKYDKV